MAKHAMPFLIINYGAEMVFILDQRLQAQNVTSDKSGKVLHDVVRAMFAPAFVEELMRPQNLYTPAATKEIFDRLAHSSIMRLSENSMDKLYDLMTMGCKYQLFNMRHPMELVELTLNHIDSVRSALTAQHAESLAHVESQFRSTFRAFKYGVLMDARHALLNFFQGRRVKVSLFLQEGMQNPDSTFNLPTDAPAVPCALQEKIGTIRYFDGGKLVFEEPVALPVDVVRPKESTSVTTASWDAWTTGMRMCTMGTNLYLSDRRKKPTSTTNQDALSAVGAPGSQQPASKAARPGVSPAASPTAMSPAAVVPTVVPLWVIQRSQPQGSSTAATGALNFLSQLIGPSTAPSGNDHFKLNLFDDDQQQGAAAASSSYASGGDFPSGTGGEEPVIQIRRITKEEMLSSNKELADVLHGFSEAAIGGQQPAQQQDSLLDLMDEAN